MTQKHLIATKEILPPSRTKYVLPYVVIFIPAYNEAAMIGKVVQVIRKNYVGDTERGYWADVVVVDDGSTDHTVAKARQAGAARVISHPMNQGLVAATPTGFFTSLLIGCGVGRNIFS